ncbi:MFS transporter [Nocardia australiensis]|uniref:MFS transporter n=1 Tax=Nocardia australiensis TaxID=2887191 RepID=UPI001D14C26E|nr:MFS transporter [Nocardia australiensis]
MTETHSAGTSSTDSLARPGLLLAAVLVAVLVVPTGVSGTGVALPDIAADLGTAPSALQWVVNGFNLTFAAFSLVAGSLADHLGLRRGFLLGTGLFGAASILSAVAPVILVLDLARALAGVGAATIFACGGALLGTQFDGAARTKAFALFGTVAGVGLGFGPSLSAAAIALVGWPGMFVVNAVLIIIAAGLALRCGVVDVLAAHRPPIDYRGALLFASGLALVIAGIVQASEWGWTAPGTLLVEAAGLGLLALFVVVQRRSVNPLLDLSLLADPILIGLLLVPVAGAVGFVTLLTYLPTFLASVWQLSTATVGFVMLIMTVPVIFAPIIAGRLSHRGVSPRVILTVSVALYVLGTVWLTVIGTDRSIVTLVGPPILLGAGFGLGVGLVDGAAIGSVPPAKSGMVSGLVSTVRLGSEAVVVAVYASVMTTLVGSQVHKLLPSSLPAEVVDDATAATASGDLARVDAVVDPALLHQAYNNAIHPALWALAATSAVFVLLVGILLRPKRTDTAILDPLREKLS